MKGIHLYPVGKGCSGCVPVRCVETTLEFCRAQNLGQNGILRSLIVLNVTETKIRNHLEQNQSEAPVALEPKIKRQWKRQDVTREHDYHLLSIECVTCLQIELILNSLSKPQTHFGRT